MLKTKYQATGELKVFQTLWGMSDKRSWLSGRSLTGLWGSDRWVNCFAHVLNKKRWPDFRLYMGNICILHPDSHYIIDHGTLKDRISYSQKVKSANFDKWDTLAGELRELYNKTFPAKVGTMIMKYSKEEVREQIASLNLAYLEILEADGRISRTAIPQLQTILRQL